MNEAQQPYVPRGNSEGLKLRRFGGDDVADAREVPEENVSGCLAPGTGQKSSQQLTVACTLLDRERHNVVGTGNSGFHGIAFWRRVAHATD